MDIRRKTQEKYVVESRSEQKQREICVYVHESNRLHLTIYYYYVSSVSNPHLVTSKARINQKPC